MATLDKIQAEKKGAKKAKAEDNNMANAVARTEKIRDWVGTVTFFHNFLIQTEHVIEIEALAKDLQTTIKSSPESTTYFGLTEAKAQEKLKLFGPN